MTAIVVFAVLLLAAGSRAQTFLEAMDILWASLNVPAWADYPDAAANCSCSPSCSWSGITCDPNGGAITIINLSQASYYSSSGVLPTEIAAFNATLKELHIRGSSSDDTREGLKGTIPTEIGLLTALTTLDLDNNWLEGTMPTELSLLVNCIRGMSISKNLLYGSIPMGLSVLDTIEFDFSYNFLNSSLDAALQAAANLTTLRLNNNMFTGTIPTVLPAAPQIKYLDLSSNPLLGGLPSEIGSLVSLTELYISNCGLTGAIPSSLEGLTALFIIDLSNNLFTSFPIAFFDIDYANLYLQNNKFGGQLPSELSNPRADTINLSGNGYTGYIPTVQTTRLRELDLSNNPFGTTLPNMRNFHLAGGGYLYLRNCSLVGPLPEWNTTLNYGVIDLSYNSLYGSLDNIAAMKPPIELYLDHNYFEGSIPLLITNWLNVLTLDLSDNLLSGNVAEFKSNSSFIKLDLSNNNFTGPYPTSFVAYADVDFTRNNFDGCDQAPSKPNIELSCRLVPIGTPPPTVPPPPTVTPVATTTQLPSTGPPSSTLSCQQPPPLSTAECLDGVWVINTSGPIGNLSSGNTPIVIIGPAVIGNNSVIVVTPGGNITVIGNVTLGGVIVIQFPDDHPPTEEEYIPIIYAGSITGNVSSIVVQGKPKCGKATATGVTSTTQFGAIISVVGCHNHQRNVAIIVGCTVAGVLLVTVAIIVILVLLKKSGKGRSLFHRDDPTEDLSSLT